MEDYDPKDAGDEPQASRGEEQPSLSRGEEEPSPVPDEELVDRISGATERIRQSMYVDA